MAASENLVLQNKEALKAFLLDISCLQKLNPWVSKVNIFDVLKISRTEIRHSNVLAWLFDANENHGLNDLFIRGVIHKAVEKNKEYFDAKFINVLSLLTSDYSHFFVYREWNSIDILLVSHEDKTVICIENKIGTGEHDNQLARYKDKVESNFLKSDGYDYIYIYLTPDKNSASDTDNWISFSYVDILEILNDITKSENIEKRASFIIENYIETLRRFVVKDKELEEICQDIYKKHRQALDLIFENRPNSNDLTTIVSDILNEYFMQRATNQKDILFVQNKFNSPKTIKRFSLESFDRLFPPIANAQGFWGDGINYFWEVKHNASSGRINIIFEMCNYEVLNGGKATKLAELLNIKLNDNWSWKTFESINIDYANGKLEEFIELGYEDKRSKIIAKLDTAMEKVFKFENKVLSLWK